MVLSFGFFRQYYPELFTPHNITVMRKQSGPPEVHVPLSCRTDDLRMSDNR